jgi:protein-tyrosine phosphatase
MRKFTILAVCTANICRSPVIEILLRQRLDPDRFVIGSAGTQGWRNAPVDSMVVLELERLGARADGFASRILTDDLIEDADLILTAARDHRADVLRRRPDALSRTFTLREFAGLVEDVNAESPAELVAGAYRRRREVRGDVDLQDPFRSPPAVHRAVTDQIAAAVATTADRLGAAAT